jgi:hypothetical protein
MPTRTLRAFLPALLVALVLSALIATPARAVLGSVSASWPASTLTRGSSVAVTGHVSGLQLGDGVVLQQKVSGGWRNISKVRLDSARNYRLPVPTWWIGIRSYRVITTSLLKTTLLGTPSTTWAVDVRPSYVAPGRAFQHTYATPSYARWNPCATIGYRVNARQATTGATKDVKEAFRRISQATGFRFAYRGTTSRIPQAGGNSWYPADTQIVVAWARPSQSTMLAGYSDAVGVGAAITSGGYRNGDGTTISKIIRGAVVVDARRSYRAGFGSGNTRGDIVLHEIGHTMGLGHTGAIRQIMYPRMTSYAARLGKGDLNGLFKRGARLGCVEAITFRTTAPRLGYHALP